MTKHEKHEIFKIFRKHECKLLGIKRYRFLVSQNSYGQNSVCNIWQIQFSANDLNSPKCVNKNHWAIVVWTFLCSESSTSSPGGNQVDCFTAGLEYVWDIVFDKRIFILDIEWYRFLPSTKSCWKTCFENLKSDF